MKEITVRIQENFGRRDAYPVCKTAIKLAKLCGSVCFSPDKIAIIKELGFTVLVEPQTI